MNRLVLTILWLGPSTNEIKGAHWSVYNKYKKAALAALKQAVQAQYPRLDITIVPPVKITLRAFLGRDPITNRLKSAYDIDNYSSCYKMLQDSAVDLGIIPNDTDKFVSAFEIERPARFKDWHKPGLPTLSHCVLEIKSIK